MRKTLWIAVSLLLTYPLMAITPEELSELKQRASQMDTAALHELINLSADESIGISGKELMRYCTVAAGQDNVEAQLFLYKCYSAGKYVTADTEMAKMWKNSIIATGKDDAISMLGKAMMESSSAAERREGKQLCMGGTGESGETSATADRLVESAEPEYGVASPVSFSSSEEAQKMIMEEALFHLVSKVSSVERYPELNSEVKTLLDMLENYYQVLYRENSSPQDKARISLLMAQIMNDTGAYAKAQTAFEKALSDYESWSAADKNSTLGQHILYESYCGIGFCLLSQSKASEALPWYEKALKPAESRYHALLPDDGEEIAEDVDEMLARAVVDVLDAYRCLGDCHRAADDSETAEEMYQKGTDVVNRVKRLTPDMSIAYVKLLASQGNLQNANGNMKEALSSWLLAAKICEQVNAAATRLDIKAETKRFHDILLPTIQEVVAKLKEEESNAPAKSPKSAPRNKRH